jgi:hypothetical protein
MPDPTDRPITHETPGAYPGTRTALDRIAALVTRHTDASDLMVRKADLRELLALAAAASMPDALPGGIDVSALDDACYEYHREYESDRDADHLAPQVAAIRAALGAVATPAAEPAQAGMVGHVTMPQSVSQGHTGKRVRYEFGDERWDAWLVTLTPVPGRDMQATVTRDNGEAWLVLAKNLTPIDAPAATAKDGGGETTAIPITPGGTPV